MYLQGRTAKSAILWKTPKKMARPTGFEASRLDPIEALRVE
jgi:hypothetical protein